MARNCTHIVFKTKIDLNVTYYGHDKQIIKSIVYSTKKYMPILFGLRFSTTPGKPISIVLNNCRL